MRDRLPSDPSDARAAIRSGEYQEPTSGICLGYVQANLVILPEAYAEDFRAFCAANPRPMPLLEMTQPGDPVPHRTAPSADLRTDVPRYRVYRRKGMEETTDIRPLWRDDFVSFLLGCSFTTEEKLLDAGVRLRHVELGRNVAMFRTDVPCAPAGQFRGPLVVSMRPIRRDQVELARRVTADYPLAHGAPVHVGDPAAIGVADLGKPDWGDALELQEDEVPVFWACGVTPQAAIAVLQPEIAITHAPGHMFLTDLRDAEICGRDGL